MSFHFLVKDNSIFKKGLHHFCKSLNEKVVRLNNTKRYILDECLWVDGLFLVFIVSYLRFILNKVFNIFKTEIQWSVFVFVCVWEREIVCVNSNNNVHKCRYANIWKCTDVCICGWLQTFLGFFFFLETISVLEFPHVGHCGTRDRSLWARRKYRKSCYRTSYPATKIRKLFGQTTKGICILVSYFCCIIVDN